MPLRLPVRLIFPTVNGAGGEIESPAIHAILVESDATARSPARDACVVRSIASSPESVGNEGALRDLSRTRDTTP